MSSDSESSGRKRAAALIYDKQTDAPRLVAKGYGALAEQIIAEAQRAGVFVHESPELIGLLMQVNLDEQIPPSLYVAVAELLIWLADIQSSPSDN